MQRVEVESDNSVPRGRLALRGWISWPLLLAFWSVPAVLFSTQTYYWFRMEDRPISFWHILAWQAAGFYYWVPATPLVFRLCRRVPVSGPRSRLWGLKHVGAALLLAAIHLSYLTWLTIQFAPEPYNQNGPMSLLFMWAVQRLPLDLMIYGGLLGVGYGLESYRRERERELMASQLQTQLAQAQLQALKMQLHPHFLFNTLHVISVLVRKGAHQQAVRMLAGLSDLLRLALENVGTQEVPLKQELEFLERYLELEQIRFQDRLKVELDIDPRTLDIRVPNLLLQPLVENAIRHGIAQDPRAGMIRVRAGRVADRLRVEVRDDGPGLPADGEAHREGVGMSNTRKRLQRLYGDEHLFTLTNGEHGGAVAVVEVPFRFAP